MTTRPADAEQLDYGPFLVKEFTASLLLPPLTQIKWKIVCPKCSATHPSTANIFTCECGLSMQMDGHLFIWWRKKEPAL